MYNKVVIRCEENTNKTLWVLFLSILQHCTDQSQVRLAHSIRGVSNALPGQPGVHMDAGHT